MQKLRRPVSAVVAMLVVLFAMPAAGAAATTTPTAATATVVTEADGFRFGVDAATPTDVNQYNYGLLEGEAVADPGETYINVRVTVINEQSDRSAFILDLVGSATGSDIYLGGPDPLSADEKTNEGCATSGDLGVTLPAGMCLIGADDQAGGGAVVLEDGTALADEGLTQGPLIPASGRATINAYFGPVSSGYKAQNASLFFYVVSNGGTTANLVRVPIGSHGAAQPASGAACLMPHLAQPSVPVLSAAQASAELGQKVTFAAATGPADHVVCQWDGPRLPKKEVRPYRQYTVELWLGVQGPFPNNADAAASFTPLSRAFGAPTAVAGVGSAAAFLPGQDEITGQLLVLSGVYVFTVSLNSPAPLVTQQRQLVAVARSVLGHLPVPLPLAPAFIVTATLDQPLSGDLLSLPLTRLTIKDPGSVTATVAWGQGANSPAQFVISHSPHTHGIGVGPAVMSIVADTPYTYRVLGTFPLTIMLHNGLGQAQQLAGEVVVARALVGSAANLGGAKLAAMWNTCWQCGQYVDLPDLHSIGVDSHYLGIMETTQEQTDHSPSTAAAFIKDLDQQGSNVFNYFSLVNPGLGLLAGFPDQLAADNDPDAIQVLGLAIYSGDFSPVVATNLTLSWLAHSECAACTDNSALSEPSLAALTLIYDWGHPTAEFPDGYLISRTPTSTEQQLLTLGITSAVGWQIINVGAAAYAVKTLPGSASDPPTADDLDIWVNMFRTEVVKPIVNTMGNNWASEAEQNALVSGTQSVAIGALVGAAIPIPGLDVFGAIAGALVGIVLGMWGAVDTSGIGAEYNQVVGFDNQGRAEADLFSLAALLHGGRIYPNGLDDSVPLTDNPANIRAVWLDYAENRIGQNSDQIQDKKRPVTKSPVTKGTEVDVWEPLPETPLGTPFYLLEYCTTC
jgi:hypothetical protein